MENRDKKIKSLGILTTLLDFVKNDKYIIDTYYIENDLDACYAGSAVRKIPKVIGKTVEIKFSKLDPIPNYTHGTPRTGIMDDWKDLNIKNIPTDFFDNDNYETECFGTHKEWGHCFSDFKNKIAMVELINDPDELFKYRYKLKPEPPQPIIIKSGDTWVAEWEGIDYLWIGKLSVDMEEVKKTFKSPDAFNIFVKEDCFKLISEIEITDEIAKLRPMMVRNLNIKTLDPRKLYSVIKDRVATKYVIHGDNVYNSKVSDPIDWRLATVKDLQE